MFVDTICRHNVSRYDFGLKLEILNLCWLFMVFVGKEVFMIDLMVLQFYDNLTNVVILGSNVGMYLLLNIKQTF